MQTYGNYCLDCLGFRPPSLELWVVVVWNSAPEKKRLPELGGCTGGESPNPAWTWKAKIHKSMVYCTLTVGNSCLNS